MSAPAGGKKPIKESIAAGTEKQDITLNDMVCWCVIRALGKFPEPTAISSEAPLKPFKKFILE